MPDGLKSKRLSAILVTENVNDGRKGERCVPHCRADKQRNTESFFCGADLEVLLGTRSVSKRGLLSGAGTFFEAARRTPPANAVIALPGVDGLNAAEHLRALLPETRVIWCSDLDFSLHAFRLRVDYFLLEPVTSDAFRQGLCVWFGETMPSARNGADSEE